MVAGGVVVVMIHSGSRRSGQRSMSKSIRKSTAVVTAAITSCASGRFGSSSGGKGGRARNRGIGGWHRGGRVEPSESSNQPH